MDRPEDMDQAEGVPLDPATEAELLKSFRSLPTEDDLPCGDVGPMETVRHRDQMFVLIESPKTHWAERGN